MEPREGFEPSTIRLEGGGSFPLSYRDLVPPVGLEPTTSALSRLSFDRV